MPQIPIIMPQLGESIAEAAIINFLVQPGEAVEARIAGLGDVDRLNDLLDRILDVATGDELLAPWNPSA